VRRAKAEPISDQERRPCCFCGKPTRRPYLGKDGREECSRCFAADVNARRSYGRLERKKTREKAEAEGAPPRGRNQGGAMTEGPRRNIAAPVVTFTRIERNKP
jgi:hypothetical protein